jgi:hypothetical protein
MCLILGFPATLSLSFSFDQPYHIFDNSSLSLMQLRLTGFKLASQSTCMQTLFTILEELKFRNPVLFYFGAICLIAGMFCIPALIWSNQVVQGVNAWYKPFKFFLAICIYVWTMGWIIHELPDADRLILWFSWSMVLLFTYEDLYIIIQAARGQMSHFNLSTPFYRAMYAGMAMASAGISLWTAVVFLKFMTGSFQMDESWLWGIRIGLLLFVIFSLQGFIMGGRLSHTVGAADGSGGMPITQWSKTHGDLRIAHFLGMHALQLIPLSGWLLKNKWLTLLFGLLYSGLVVFSLVNALQGKPLFTR